MPTPAASVFAAVLDRYDATGAAALAPAFLHDAPLRAPGQTAGYLAPPYAVIADGGLTQQETFEYHGVETQALTVTVYASTQAQAAQVAALARWDGAAPGAGLGLDHADLAVARRRVLGVWCGQARTGAEAARDGSAKPVFTLAFDVSVQTVRDAGEAQT